MRFYDREKELGVLERAYLRRGADLLVITGRRRIGKSRLVEEFLRGKKAVSLLIVPKEEKQVAKDIEEEIRSKFGYSPAFDTLRAALEYIFEQGIDLVWLDEFPNVLAVNAATSYEVQGIWDKYKEKKDVLLVVSGSYAGMMNRLFTAKKAPLFNRATNTLNLGHLPFGTVVEILNDLGLSEPKEQIAHYCVFGGAPYYYLLLERQGTKKLESSVNALFFEEGAQLKEEGENVLKQEFGNAYAKYYALLEAIHSGHVSMNEISQKLGVRSTTLMKYVEALQQDFKLIGRVVPFGQVPAKSKKGLYFIIDNTLAFWFAHVYGKRTPPSKDELGTFLGRRFELFCKDALIGYLENRGERVLKSGKWWGHVETEEKKFGQREIDLIVETDKALYIGECKWSEQKTGESELKRLRESAKHIAAKTKKPVKWVLFSKEGFSDDIQKRKGEVLLFDAPKLVEASRMQTVTVQQA